MARFSIKYPYFLIVSCLITCILGVAFLVRMPVDLFPEIRIPVVVVATFYSGMPPEEVETGITSRFERFFTLASGIDHIESRSLPGVSLIKIYFQPGSSADTAVSTIANLAMANLRRLPPGTLPPVVLKFDASSLPVCLITLKANGLSETELRDLGQFNVRNQVASVPGASVPPPFGGKYRQIMVYVDPLKLQANQLSMMDVVRKVNDANVILPAGDVKIGPIDYNLYTNSQLDTISEVNAVPLKTVGASSVTIADIGAAKDGHQIQTNVVRVDGQPSVYLPVLKQGGDSNTIAIVSGVKSVLANLTDVPKQLVTKVVFDQSLFVKSAIENLLHEGGIGLVLTGIMVLVFLGSWRATLGVFFSIPLSALATFVVLALGGETINSMILGGLALAFSRLIDNSVVVIENIYRHLELGEDPVTAAENGGQEVALPVLAATLTTAIVFFPVLFLYGVSRFLFSTLALAVVISLFASYVVAMTVVPLFCAKYLRGHGGEAHPARDAIEPDLAGEAAEEERLRPSWSARFQLWFNTGFERLLAVYEKWVGRALVRPAASLAVLTAICLVTFVLLPFLNFAYFPRTDPGQFVVNIKTPTGTRIENTSAEVGKVEDIIRRIVDKDDLDVITSNIGTAAGFSAIYSPNTASHTGFVQVSLKEGHKIGSYEYMNRVRAAVNQEAPELTTYFQSGGLVDAVLNLGLPAPIDIQVSGSNLETAYKVASNIARDAAKVNGVSDVFIPQDVDAPAFKLNVDRVHASELGLTEKEIVDSVITALTSNQMIAPSYWVDPKSGYDYMLTVQYPEKEVKSIDDLRLIPVRGEGEKNTTQLALVADIKRVEAPTVVDHYQLKRVIDVYIATKHEDLSRVETGVDNILAHLDKPSGIDVTMRGSIAAMHQSFDSFGIGLLLAIVLVYLILVAQFQSFVDPFIILLAIPPALAGVLIALYVTGTSLNVMSLMGTVMLMGIVVSNSILIVEFTRHLIADGTPLREAVVVACRVRLRPVLMTSLATIIGLIPMALALGSGSEAYASLARVIIGGLTVSVVFTVFLVPLAYLLIHRGGGPAAHATHLAVEGA